MYEGNIIPRINVTVWRGLVIRVALDRMLVDYSAEQSDAMGKKPPWAGGGLCEAKSGGAVRQPGQCLKCDNDVQCGRESVRC